MSFKIELSCDGYVKIEKTYNISNNRILLPIKLLIGGKSTMDEFIKAQLDGIELSSQRITNEAHNISLRLTAIFGYSAGHESGVQYWLQNQ